MKKTTYNLKSIMTKAWELVKKYGYTLSRALKTSWANAKAIAEAFKANLVEEECHTYGGWMMLGYEVTHGEKCKFQVVVNSPKTNSGLTTLSYFFKSQTHKIGEV